MSRVSSTAVLDNLHMDMVGHALRVWIERAVVDRRPKWRFPGLYLSFGLQTGIARYVKKVKLMAVVGLHHDGLTSAAIVPTP